MKNLGKLSTTCILLILTTACSSGGDGGSDKEGKLHCSDTDCESRFRECIPATDISYAVCGDCVAETYEHAGQCVPTTLCKSTEFEFVAPTSNRDRECKAYSVECTENQYQLADRTPTSDRVCAPYHVECSSDEYLLEDRTPTSDRVCAPPTPCPMGERILEPHTATEDRVCTSCVAGEYCAGGDAAPRACGRLQVDDNPATPCAAIVDLTAGNLHGCVLDDHGRIHCWGESDDDRLGAPTAEEGPFLAVRAGADFTCALHQNGTVQCWGELFESTSRSLVPPVDLPPLIQIAAGNEHVCGIDVQHQVHCWGANNYSQLAFSNNLPNVYSIDSKRYHTCALDADGGVHCWGDMIGYHASNVPQDLPPIAQIVTGGYHTCARDFTNAIYCWGDNEYQQLSIPDDIRNPQLLFGAPFTTCALQDANEVWCWGRDIFPPPAHPLTAHVVINEDYTCIRTEDGFAVCFGRVNDVVAEEIPSEFGP